MKILFWIFAWVGMVAFGVALGGLVFGPESFLYFFQPLSMIGVSGTAICNFIYYSKKQFLGDKERNMARVLLVVMLLIMILPRWLG